MAFSDKDLQVVTQIAYMDFDERVQSLGDCTLKELLEKHSNYLENAQRSLANAKSEIEREQAQAQIDLYNEIVKDDSKYADWKIKNVRDDNSRTGFYACMIDAGNGEAIVGFRGSESDDTQILKDWINADIGLLNSIETEQQECAAKYMKYLYEEYGDEFESFSLTGHSLGGNLAFHGAVSAPDEMKDKITQAVSFDGPGFSDEYISAHYADIQKAASKMRHYEWSPVGALLLPLPGVKSTAVKIQDAPEGEEGNYYLIRHDSCFVVFNDDGNIIEVPEPKDLEILGEISQYIDKITNGVGLVGALQFVSFLLSSPALAVGGAGAFVFFKNVFSSAAEWIEKNIIRTNREANFDVKIAAVRQTYDVEVNVQKELAYIADEIDNIKNHISGGIWMWGVKSKLGRTASNVGKESRGMQKMSEVALNVISQYVQSENRIISNCSTTSASV